MEDTATGSAHCYLAGYWLRDGAYADTCQLSPAGTALMRVRLEGDQVWVTGNVALDEA